MALTITPVTVSACSSFTVSATGAPAGAVNATFTYDGAPPQTVAVTAGAAGPVTFTAAGSGAQLVSVVYTDAVSAVVGADTGTVTVTAAPAGTLTTTLTTAGGVTTAATTLTCPAGLTGLNGTITYTLPGGATVTATVTNGVVATVPLGVNVLPGQTVGVSFTPAAGTCAACTFAPITVTVPAQTTCSVVVLPVVAPVTVGQPVQVTAVVTCGGIPVAGATVTFNGGTSPVTVTTNALGIATGLLTFGTAGTATVTATVTAAGTSCSCSGVVSLPITITVQQSGNGPLQALPACWRVNVPFPLPNLFTATLRATVTPATAGVPVTFSVGGQVVGTAVTDASGTATLNAGLSLLQILSGTYTASATINGTPVQATSTLTPCLPPV
ncbi:hypothetical protein ACWCPX_21925 [Streptomyces olivaceoviridis]|nr:hypothetical protein SHL15_9240 [Streptomyces hygroscopicus subsp. limoneus]